LSALAHDKPKNNINVFDKQEPLEY